MNKKALESRFDFSPLFGLQQEMRESFRKLSLSDKRFEAQLARSHNKFFQKIMQNKRHAVDINLQNAQETNAKQGKRNMVMNALQRTSDLQKAHEFRQAVRKAVERDKEEPVARRSDSTNTLEELFNEN